MKEIIAYTFLFVTFLSCSSQKDKQEIESCFNLYSENLLQNNGKQAVEYLDENTIDYYKKIFEHVKYSEKHTILKQNYASIYIILQARNKILPDSIKGMDGKSLLSYAIDNGMIGKNSLDSLEFVEVSEIKNNKAKAIIKLKGTSKTFIFIFNNESGKWKMSLTPVIKMTMRTLNVMHLGMGHGKVSLENFILELVKTGNSGVIKENIWEPILEQ
ncbi:MAG: hypothetical protein ACK5MZ_04075 [Aestuariibaculum sp.]